ncbi:MAG: hypothetical protein WBJ34_03125 [Syntrophomonadaceae bacterium]|jgi:hypothetical protein
MLDLDFAYFNLQTSDRKGLASRKYFLDRLAPLLYAPRIEKLIEIPQLAAGCNIHLPLGAGNVAHLDEPIRQNFFAKLEQLLQEMKLTNLSAQRSLRQIWPELGEYFALVWGDDFIKALGYTLVQEIMSRQGADKIILVGDIYTYSDLLEALTGFGVPISVQSLKPVDYEVMTYRLLYDRGCAVSNSYVNPSGWEKGNLILVFDGEAESMIAAQPGQFLFRLTNDSRGLAPELEEHLEQNGIGGSLGTIAPILESCIKVKAGIASACAELDMSRPTAPFEALQQAGEQIGVWDIFLDKVY